MKILGIETSCDETSAAIVEDGQKVISSVVSSSVELHKKYKGIVPEIAAREQIKVITPVIETALEEAGKKPKDLDALAITIGPGLIGSLLVGVETAKTLAFAWNKPLVGVNHLTGHIYSNLLNNNSPFKFPPIVLIVSGGHTDLILMTDHGKYKLIGGTRDDATGEAFDKVARILGLGYPGGPAIEKAAKNGDPKAFNFPRPLIDTKNFDFSFSGLKTAVVNTVKKADSCKQLAVSNLAASFQEAVVDVLVKKTIRAAEKFDAEQIIVGGGVSANSLLRSRLSLCAKQIGISVKVPPLEFTTDNGAMIASAAYFNFKPKPISAVQANPSLHF